MGVMKDFDIRIRSGGDDAIAAVSELMPRWISVSERLPERNEIVLATDQGGVTVGSYSPMLDDWWTLQVDRIAPGAVVTHWMPLPEPPEVTP